MSDANLLGAASGVALPVDVVKGLVARGIPEHIAIGAAAGVGAETKGDPNAVNPKTGALGYGQWLGSRKDQLLSTYGGKLPSPDQQIDYLAWELKGGDPGMASVMSAKNPQEAADLYIRNGMRPGEKDLPADLGRAHQYLSAAQPQAAPQGIVPASFTPAQHSAPDPFDPQGSLPPAATGATPNVNDPFDPGVHPDSAAGQGGGNGNSVSVSPGGRNVLQDQTGTQGGPQGASATGLQPHQALGVIPGTIEAAANGASAGLIKPIVAALDAILPNNHSGDGSQSVWDGGSLGDAYHHNLGIERGAADQFRSDHPALSISADLAGAIASPLNKLWAPAEGASFAKSIGNYMLQGATYGGVRGLADTGTPEGLATGVGVGALLGAPAAAVGNIAGKAIGAVLRGRSTLANAIPQSIKQRIAEMIDAHATVDQIHDAIPESKEIANIPQWVQFRAKGGKGPVTWGDVPSVEAANDTARPNPVDIAKVLKGGRQGIESVKTAPPQVQEEAQRLGQAGVSPDEALREADIRYVGAKPTVAAVTRNPQEQMAFNEGAKLDPSLNAAQAANNEALHNTVANTVENYGGVVQPGDAAETAAQTLAKASDAERAKVTDLYKQADEQAASLKKTSDTDAAQRQAAADAQAAQDAQAAARAKLNEAQQAYKASKTDINADPDKALKDLQAARENLRNVTVNPPKAAPVPSRTAPGYIDVSPVVKALNTPEMANPNTEGLRALVNGAKGYIAQISNGTNRVSAEQAENIRQFFNGAYDPMGSGINNAIGNLKSTLDQAMDAVPDASQAYKTARAAHKAWAEQYDNPQGVARLIKRDAQGNFVHADGWRNAQGLTGPSSDKPFSQVAKQLQKIGATDALNKIKASIVQTAHDAARNSAADANGNPVFNGKLFQNKLNSIGMPKLQALFSPQEIAHLATIGRAARHLNEPVPGTLNTSNTTATTRSSLASALKAKPGQNPVMTVLKLGSAAMGHVPAAVAIHGAEHLSNRAAQGAISRGIREQLNTGLARASANRSESRIANELYRKQMGRALSSRAAPAGADPDQRRALARGLKHAF